MFWSCSGNLCKILTVVVNILIWDKHASTTGLAFLFVCLASAAFYRQAPLRECESAHEAKVEGKLLEADNAGDEACAGGGELTSPRVRRVSVEKIKVGENVPLSPNKV